ncbi:pirin family protein [Sulfoacidibacillus ferrooxidans]|uniref:Pirin N-terminal domain-containing protein n=1 Tax=Sulfoacidibacillus ferrooxidans TaxID=2005001 RepID=A0A9X2AFF4_9BACL|nr:pirin family protein [Sulfoacidibacillus ferrooxidans]MCI0184001.1 hypothetical protein [Sulfoacidibacillus ferrooxidans]
MNKAQKIKGLQTMDGDGAQLRRLLPSYHVGYLDPFLLFDHFSVQKPAGFPSHPHRGFETITYMLQGAFLHEDSVGRSKMIVAGGVQRITAGSGIVHSEMPGANGINQGLQLWVNLPREQKGMEPSYQNVASADLPVFEQRGVRRKILVGLGSPVTLQQPMLYEDISLDPNEGGLSVTLTVPSGYQSMMYVFLGSGVFGTESIEVVTGELIIFEPSSKVQSIVVRTINAISPLQFVYVSAQTIGERPIFRGSYVD